MTGPPLHVLIVTDSAVVREVMLAVLSTAGDMKVTTAPDALATYLRIAMERPDVILLDLDMRREDGLTFLRELMADLIPVVVCSSHGTAESAVSIQALREGAVEVVAKPQLPVHEFVRDAAIVLADAVRAAARVQSRRGSRLGVTARAPARANHAHPASRRVVAIAASTGGPQAVEQVLTALPADAPGIVVAQHLPAGFTAAFARHLDTICVLEVKEAEDGDPVTDGLVLIAPGDRHLLVQGRPGGLVAEVADGPLVSRHRPSADVLFHSLAQAAGPAALGIVLTGMGTDGARGLHAMRTVGAATIAQDEASCVVFDMPKEAIEQGAVSAVVPLSRIAERISRWTVRPETLLEER